MNTTFKFMGVFTLATGITMSILKYSLSPSINHLQENKNSYTNQSKLNIMKEVKTVNNNDHRIKLKLRAKNNLGSFLKGETKD